MQIHHFLALFIAGSTLLVSTTAAQNVKFTVAYPNLTIKKPVWSTALPGGDKELIVAQGGVIYELPKDRKAKSAPVWLDLTKRVVIDKDFEEGLLGLAFHPKHEANGKFYVYYSRQDPKRAILSEFVAKDGKPDTSSERVLLEIAQPFWNHRIRMPAARAAATARAIPAMSMSGASIACPTCLFSTGRPRSRATRSWCTSSLKYERLLATTISIGTR